MKQAMTKRPAAFQPADFDLEQFLPYRLSVLTNIVSAGLARQYRAHHPLTVTEWRILAVLGRFPGLVASEVCTRTAMDKVAISRGVRSLMEKRLLERRTDHGDRRRQRLFIAAGPGERVLRGVVPVALLYEHQLLQTLDEGELELLSGLIDKLRRRAEDLAN